MRGPVSRYRIYEAQHSITSAQVVKVATLVGLQDVFDEHPAVPANEVRCGRLPVTDPSFQFSIRHQQLQPPGCNIELDGVSILDHS